MFRVSFSRFASHFAVAGLLLTSLTPVAKAQDVLNGIAAVVNNEVITFSQVRELVGSREQAAKQQLKGEELVNKIKEIRLQAINDLIDRQLILQEFNNQKFQIPDYFIDDRVNTIVREEFAGDRQAFIRTIEAQGFTIARFKELERDKIIVQEMTRTAVRQNIVVSEPQIREYYQKHLSEFSTDEEIQLRMIAIQKGNASDRGRRVVQEIRQKILDGAEFGDLAHMYSEESHQESHGDWGWINRKVLNEELTNAAFSLKPGEVSQILDIGDSYYLLQVEAKKAGVSTPFKDVRDQIEKTIIQQQRQKLREEWLLKLRKKAFIKMY